MTDQKYKVKVFEQNAIKLNKIKDNKINLIVTSPPYLNVIKYGQYNWIRLWFIGENAKEVDQNLFTSQSLIRYINFMKDFLIQAKRVTKKDGRIVLVIGDIKDLNLAEEVWKHSAKPLGLIKEHLIVENINEKNKTTKIWNTRRGRATKVDRVLVLSK